MTEQELISKNANITLSNKVAKEHYIIEDIEDTNSRLTPSITPENLSIVKGVGPYIAGTLLEGGIANVRELAYATPQRLASLQGIGLPKAQKLIESAKDHLQNKKLNGFSNYASSLTGSLENVEKSKNILEPQIQSIEDDDKVESIANFEDFDEEYSAIEEDEIDNPVVHSKLEVQEQDINSDGPYIKEPHIITQVPNSITSEAESIIEQEREPIVTPDPSLGKEAISSEQLKQLENRARNKLEESGFYIIEKTAEIHKLASEIDIVAVKFISDWSYHKKSNGHTDLVLIIPIKISPLRGSLIVSEDKIEYSALDKSSDFYVKRLPMSYIEALNTTEKAIRTNLSEKGALFTFFNKILSSSLSLTRTFTKKNLYFHSGNAQCEILIEPVIVSQNVVGFTEKILPFAYQKNSNIHVLQVKELSEFLEYIETKYVLLESSTTKESLQELHSNAGNKLQKQLKFNMPFMTLGFLYLAIFMLQAHSLLGVVNKVALGSIIGMLGLIFGIMLAYLKNISTIRREFSMPYHKRDLHLDNSSLKLINKGLFPTLMEQFSYECLGKNPGFKIIEKVEKQNSQNFLQEKALKKKVDETELFEEEEEIKISENSDTSDERNGLKQKYSSFLED